MNITEIAKRIKKSPSYVYKTLQGKNNGKDIEKITLLLNFEERTLPDLFLNDCFLELCETAIMKSKNLKTKEFAAYCKQLHLFMKGKNALS